MALKLPERDLPLVAFRRVLPEYLALGCECFIEIDARAGGAINAPYVAAVEKVALAARVMDRQVNRISDQDDEFVAKNDANVREAIRRGIGARYDHCVIEWRSNITTEGDAGPEPIECNRANFVALHEERIPELSKALDDFAEAVESAGQIIAEEDEATIKN